MVFSKYATQDFDTPRAERAQRHFYEFLEEQLGDVMNTAVAYVRQNDMDLRITEDRIHVIPGVCRDDAIRDARLSFKLQYVKRR